MVQISLLNSVTAYIAKLKHYPLTMPKSHVVLEYRSIDHKLDHGMAFGFKLMREIEKSKINSHVGVCHTSVM